MLTTVFAAMFPEICPIFRRVIHFILYMITWRSEFSVYFYFAPKFRERAS
jgi:hypothetical protein